MSCIFMSVNFMSVNFMSVIFSALAITRTCTEDVGTSITSQSEVVVMTIRAVSLLILAGERTIDQRHFAIDTLEAQLMPVLVLVRQILKQANYV